MSQRRRFGMGRPWSPLGRIVLRRVLGCFLLLALVGLIWYTAARLKDRSAVFRLEANIKQKGEPRTLAELAAIYPPIPNEQNAALPLQELWEKENPSLWTAVRDNRRPLSAHSEPSYDPELPYLGKNQRSFKVGQKLTPESRQAAETFLRGRAAHLDAVHSALQRPRCRFPVKIEDGTDLLLPHLFELRSDAQTLRIAALLAADDGDRSEALSALEEIVRLSDTLTDEPIGISQMVRISCLKWALSGMEDLLSRQALSAKELHRLQRLVESIEPHKMLHWFLMSEYAMGLSVFDLPTAVVARTAPSSSETQGAKQFVAQYRLGRAIRSALGLTVADRRLMLEAMDKSMELAKEDFPEAFRRITQLEAEVTRKMHRFPPKVLCAIAMPGMKKIVGSLATLEARKRCALTALAIEQYRPNHGDASPEELKALVSEFLPAVPIDPFSGQPLGYRRSENGYLLYSVGADLRDDGGDKMVMSGTGKNRDEIFAVERANRRQ